MSVIAIAAPAHTDLDRSRPAWHSTAVGGTPKRAQDHQPVEGDTPIMSATILWIIAAILVIVGIVQLIQGQIILGIVLLIAACLVGPGGYSIFRSRHA
jgi:hypothetical protein